MKQCSSEVRFQANFGRAGTWYWFVLVGHSRQKAWQARRLWPDGHTTEMAAPGICAGEGREGS